MKGCQGPIQPHAFTGDCSRPGTDGACLLTWLFVVFRAFPRRYRSSRFYVVDLEIAAADAVTHSHWISRNIQETGDRAQQSGTLLHHGTQVNPLDKCSTAARLLEIFYTIQFLMFVVRFPRPCSSSVRPSSILIIQLNKSHSTQKLCSNCIKFVSLCFTFYSASFSVSLNLLKPTGHVMHQQFNIQQLYTTLTLYLCVLYLSENKQQIVPTYSINWLVFITEMKSVYSAVRTGSLNKAVCALSLTG